MKTVHNTEQLKWHLENNVIPKLHEGAIEGILTTIKLFNKGELKLSDEVFPNARVTVEEMFEDLKIEVV